VRADDDLTIAGNLTAARDLPVGLAEPAPALPSLSWDDGGGPRP
jgi:hypothetical protein